MDKKIAGLLGAAAALATVGGVNATENPSNPATSYRDLLNPVPKALEALKADDARLANTPVAEVKLAQIRVEMGHHHHHHHHHHHMVPRVILVPPHRDHHHHHHHHHSSYYGR